MAYEDWMCDAELGERLMEQIRLVFEGRRFFLWAVALSVSGAVDRHNPIFTAQLFDGAMPKVIRRAGIAMNQNQRTAGPRFQVMNAQPFDSGEMISRELASVGDRRVI